MKSIITYGKNNIRNPFTIICNGKFVAANLLMNNDYIILCLPTKSYPYVLQPRGDVETERAQYTSNCAKQSI